MKKSILNSILLLLALLIAAIVCQYKGDAWEENVRQTLYRIKNDSIPNYAKIIVDEKGIPYVQYVAYNEIEAGEKYNATIIANYAIDYYHLIVEKKDTTVKHQFINCINWLIENMSYKDNYALFEFRWKQPFYDSVGVPWTSGMTSGRAIEAYTCAYKLSNDQQYLRYSNDLLRGFYQPIQLGSFTYKEQTGWWYEEYADSNIHTPRILDGHIYALIGVHKFWLTTKNDSAAYVVNQGISSLKNHLPSYDIGDGWSYYDAYHKKSDKKYHMLLTGLMNELWEMTKDPMFKEYYSKWNAPLIKPYIYRIIKEKNRSGLVLYFMLSTLIFAMLFFGKSLISINKEILNKEK